MSAPDSQPAEALRLHHIGHAVADLAAAAAGYRARFGYREVSAPIHDRLQTAVVQFLQLDLEPTYLELVTADDVIGKLSAVVGRGGGLHHLCYTSASLDRSIEALSREGLRLISDPTPAVAFAGRRICWLLGPDRSLVELIERRDFDDRCIPGPAAGPASQNGTG